jgi:5-methyltetrahydrofolate--homocysteine methyltransferase
VAEFDTMALIENLLQERILFLDGGMGTVIQSLKLNEEDFRGKRFTNWKKSLLGNNDLLNLTNPDVIRDIHLRYLQAGADIIETNTFSSTSISLSDYDLESFAYEINRAGAQIAKSAAIEMTELDPGRPRFVAGSLGPTNKTASMSPDVNNPAFREVNFNHLVESYTTALRGLIDGGVDILLIETIFDTLNAKAAIFAVDAYFSENKIKLPVMLSGTITDASGRTLSGQTVEAFWNSVKHINPVSVGLNCALGPDKLRQYVKELSQIASTHVSAYPNAGLPNQFGEYTLGAEEMACELAAWAKEGMLNIVGGCCGTTPEHISAMVRDISGVSPRSIPNLEARTRLSGLEAFSIGVESLFVNVGERTNVAGSAKFRNLIKEQKYEDALMIARQQVQDGAQVIDVNMDEGMLDSVQAMRTFLSLVAAEPDISKVPIMIDSSNWEVLEAGLQCIQGKGIVNSLSLKAGEEEFLKQANLVRRYGAAVVVMAFDEEGQAETVERKVDICARSYKLLTEIGMIPSDIIFDPNIFAIGTGMEEHNEYALNYFAATKILKERFPLALVSGGLSNVSFSFRGNNYVREAIHAVFLYHGIKAGMNMGIVNAGQLAIYEELPKDIRELAEDLVLNRRADATERLLGVANKEVKSSKVNLDWRDLPVVERLRHSLVHGLDAFIIEDTKEVLEKCATALEVIEGPLMSGMDVVGELFGSGKMFLPQVVKSARVMKKSVSYLEPYLKGTGQAEHRGKIVLATVQGDVHDIGKSIVKVVLECNGYHVTDLGVMVPADTILQTAQKIRADMVGVSGLITPSLDKMVSLAMEMKRLGFTIPLLIGGATTSILHTAVKIDPEYAGSIVHVKDASKVTRVVSSLLGSGNREFTLSVKKNYEQLRANFEGGESPQLTPLLNAQTRKFDGRWKDFDVFTPYMLGVNAFDNYNIKDLVPYIDWSPFFRTWGLNKRYPDILEDAKLGVEARKLLRDAEDMLLKLPQSVKASGVVGIFPANSHGDDIEVYTDVSRKSILMTLHHLRQQKNNGTNFCLSDYIAPKDSGVLDYIGAFAVTAGLGISELASAYKHGGDDYNAIMVEALADRLAEAFAERLHQRVRKDIWGYAHGESLSNNELIREKYHGIRPAPGYPACPDHTEKKLLWELLDVQTSTGMQLTESFAMNPAASVCGWYFAHPEAKYFGLGRIGEDQVRDYARRKNKSFEEMKKWLGPSLGFK